MASNLARELLQARLLAAMFRGQVKEGLALKGGMAMRVAYGSVRYTKDIDLAADESLSPDRIKAVINGAVKTTLGASSAFMKNAKFTMPKDTDTTLRWKIEGVIGGSTVNLTVEVSRRGHIPEGSIQRVSWTPPQGEGPITVDVFSMGMMAASKVDCLCNPNREAPRDVWDIEILARMGVEPDKALVAKIGRERLQSGLRDLWGKIEKMDYEVAKTQLGPYLDEKGMALFTEESWDDIRLTSYDRTKNWIEKALATFDATVPDEDAPNPEAVYA
jgi:predicted nucleotidyltransferase component of viral defense system